MSRHNIITPKSNYFKDISRLEKIGQLFSPAVYINDHEDHHSEIETLIREHNIGGLTFFHSRQSAAANYDQSSTPIYNSSSHDKLKKLIIRFQRISKYPLLISIDAEWGLAMRLENTTRYPYALTLGALQEEKNDLVYQVGYSIGIDCIKTGINLNLAPVVDINENPNNPVIGYRSFGASKENVISKSIAFYKGLRDAGIEGCFKHFPGHGNTSVDSHLDLPVIHRSEGLLVNNELAPFISGIKAGIGCIMAGHLAVPALSGDPHIPASLCSKILKDLLRDKLGFKGVVISDALNMKSVSELYPEKGELELQAFLAGNDLLCYSSYIPEAINKIDQHVSDELLNQSFDRIKKLKLRLSETIQNGKTIKNLTEIVANEVITETASQPSTLSLKECDLSGNAVISIYKKNENKFISTLNKYHHIPHYEIQTPGYSRLDITLDSLKQYDRLIISMYAPSMKSHDNYGIEPLVIDFITHLLRTKDCILCLFGNPYILNLFKELNRAKNIIVGYEDMPEFEEKAALYLTGELQAHGQLPFILNLKSSYPISNA